MTVVLLVQVGGCRTYSPVVREKPSHTICGSVTALCTTHPGKISDGVHITCTQQVKENLQRLRSSYNQSADERLQEILQLTNELELAQQRTSEVEDSYRQELGSCRTQLHAITNQRNALQVRCLTLAWLPDPVVTFPVFCCFVAFCELLTMWGGVGDA